MWGLLTLLAAGAACLLAAAAAAQPPGQDAEPGGFHLERLDARLELLGRATYDRVRKEDRRRQPGYSQTNKDWELQESFGLSFAGDVIDPQLAAFEGDASFGLTQSQYSEDRDGRSLHDRNSGHLLDYDLSLDLFRARAVSGNVSASSSERRYARRFQPSLRERYTTYGTTWWLKDPRFPMELSFESRDIDRHGNRLSIDDERLRESLVRYSGAWVISEDHRLKLKYEHARYEQSYQGSYFETDTRRDQVIVEHDLAFGPRHQYRLETLLRYQEEAGDLGRDIFEAGPRLTLEHTPDLTTYYQYQFYRESFEELTVDTHRLDFQLVHQKAKNLTSTLDVFGLSERVDDDSRTYQAGASVDFQYTRRNRLGRFNANLALAYDREEVRGGEGRRHVRGESGTFRDPLPVVLARRDVDLFSIAVRDATGRLYFVRGVDFAAQRQGTRVLLTRIPTGRIDDGDSVLIDYDYRVPARGKLDTIRVDAGLEQVFEFGLTPYYRFSYRNQEADRSTGAPEVADRTDHHRLGLSLARDRWGGSIELELYDDTVEPYDAFRLNGYVQLAADATRSLTASSTFSRFWFEGGLDRRNVSLLDLALTGRYDPTDWLLTNASLVYRFERDSVQGDTHGVDLEGGFELTFGDLKIELTAEYDLLNIADTREAGAGVWINVRRDFPNLLARR